MHVNTATESLSVTGFAPDPRQLKRVGAGIAISIALHALLLSIYRQPHGAPAPAAPDRLTVRLRPVQPAAPPVPAPQAVPKRQEPARPAPARRARPARPVISVAPETRASKDEETFKVEPAPASPAPDDAAPSLAPAPAFDLNAARALARAQANAPDPAKAGTALERLPPKPLETESRLSRSIQAAKRGNCKDGIPGGLFAPLYLMMDKKDHGCKW